MSEREGRHLRAQYGAKLSMIDHWFGRIIDAIDRHDAWDSTAFIVCTDHGHYLGEHGGIWGKPQVPVYPRARSHPVADRVAGRRAAHVRRAHHHGRPARDRCATRSASRRSTARTASSLVPLLDGRATTVREWALCGVWGREVHVIDAHTHVREVAGGDEPAAVAVLEPVVDDADPRAARLGLPESRSSRPSSTGHPGSDVPVIRQPFDPSDDLPFWAMGAFDGDLLYDHFEADATGTCATWPTRTARRIRPGR